MELIENLEETKRTSTEIMQKVELAKTTEQMINTSREQYRYVLGLSSSHEHETEWGCVRGSLLYR